MALDIQTIAMTGSYVPYERPPQDLTLWSAIPRGLQSFIVDTQVLDAKALNDDALLDLTATLPPNFGYVMNDLNFSLAQNRAADWDPILTLNLQNFYRADVNLSVGMSHIWLSQLLLSDGFFGTRRSIATTSNSLPWPTFPIIGSEGTSGVLVNINASNGNDTAAITGTVNCYISFWQFDLEQIRKYPINSPIPTHAR